MTYRHASSLAELLQCATLGFDRKTGREQYELELSGHKLALSRTLVITINQVNWL